MITAILVTQRPIRILSSHDSIQTSTSSTLFTCIHYIQGGISKKARILEDGDEIASEMINERILLTLDEPRLIWEKCFRPKRRTSVLLSIYFCPS